MKEGYPNNKDHSGIDKLIAKGKGGETLTARGVLKKIHELSDEIGKMDNSAEIINRLNRLNEDLISIDEEDNSRSNVKKLDSIEFKLKKIKEELIQKDNGGNSGKVADSVSDSTVNKAEDGEIEAELESHDVVDPTPDPEGEEIFDKPENSTDKPISSENKRKTRQKDYMAEYFEAGEKGFNLDESNGEEKNKKQDLASKDYMGEFFEAGKNKFKTEKQTKGEEIKEWKNIRDNRREEYANAYKDYIGIFGNNLKKEERWALESTIKSFKGLLSPDDPEKLKSLPPEADEYKEALRRKEKYISQVSAAGGFFTRERAEAIYNAEAFKLDYEEANINYGNALLEQKKNNLVERGMQGDDLENELKKFKAEEIAKILIYNETLALQENKIESWPPKKKNIFKKALDGYLKLPRSVRILSSVAITTAVSGGTAAGIGAAVFVGRRILGAFGGAALSQFTGKGVDTVLSRNIEKFHKSEKEKLGEQLSGGELTAEKMREYGERYQKVLEQLQTKNRKKKLIKGVAMLGTGMAAGYGLGTLSHVHGWDSQINNLMHRHATVGGGNSLNHLEPIGHNHLNIGNKGGNGQFAGENIPGQHAGNIGIEHVNQPIKLEIGSRGPEGSIIDKFIDKHDTNHELARSFGWNESKGDLHHWAETEAHNLWHNQAESALKNPDTLKQLEKLGYSKNMAGYEEMMRHIRHGSIQIDPHGSSLSFGHGAEFSHNRVLDNTPENRGQFGIDNSAQKNIHEAGSRATEDYPDYYFHYHAPGSEAHFDYNHPESAGAHNVLSDSDFKKYFESMFKINPDNSVVSLDALKNHHIADILTQDKNKFIYGVSNRFDPTYARPEWGSPNWWAIQDKEALVDKLEKIIRKIPVEDRRMILKQNPTIFNFLRNNFGKVAGK